MNIIIKNCPNQPQLCSVWYLVCCRLMKRLTFPALLLWWACGAYLVLILTYLNYNSTTQFIKTITIRIHRFVTEINRKYKYYRSNEGLRHNLIFLQFWAVKFFLLFFSKYWRDSLHRISSHIYWRYASQKLYKPTITEIIFV